MLNSKFVLVFVASYVQDTSYTQCKCTVVLSSCSCVRLDYGLIKLKGKRKISILIWIRVYNFLTGGCWLGCDLNDFSQASLLTSKKLQQLEALSILVTINLRSLSLAHFELSLRSLWAFFELFLDLSFELFLVPSFDLWLSLKQSSKL